MAHIRVILVFSCLAERRTAHFHDELHPFGVGTQFLLNKSIVCYAFGLEAQFGLCLLGYGGTQCTSFFGATRHLGFKGKDRGLVLLLCSRGGHGVFYNPHFSLGAIYTGPVLQFTAKYTKIVQNIPRTGRESELSRLGHSQCRRHARAVKLLRGVQALDPVFVVTPTFNVPPLALYVTCILCDVH